MKLGASILGRTLAYRLWQAPFAREKFAPILAHNDLRRVRSVLDVGCGPGTNTPHFAHADYLGIDINERYIEYARRRYRRNFLATDVTSYVASPGTQYDFILVNSFFHHVDTGNTRRILSHLSTLLADGGSVHVLDLVLPERPCVARLLARWDRGEFPRPLQEWKEIFTAMFDPVVLEPYGVTAFGATLWNMIYFKGRAKR